jgi:hypothetical protein
MSKRESKKGFSQRDSEALLWNHFEEFAIDGGLLSFTDHAGIKLGSAERAWDNFRDHYKRDGWFEFDRFLRDFTTWGPIASRIVELQLERDAAASI